MGTLVITDIDVLRKTLFVSLLLKGPLPPP